VLRVDLVRELAEEKKPRKIEIGQNTRHPSRGLMARKRPEMPLRQKPADRLLSGRVLTGAPLFIDQESTCVRPCREIGVEGRVVRPLATAELTARSAAQ